MTTGLIVLEYSYLLNALFLIYNNLRGMCMCVHYVSKV